MFGGRDGRLCVPLRQAQPDQSRPKPPLRLRAPTCSTMARPGTPGDELMLRAVADHFGFAINIVTSDPFMWCVLLRAFAASGEPCYASGCAVAPPLRSFHGSVFLPAQLTPRCAALRVWLQVPALCAGADAQPARGHARVPGALHLDACQVGWNEAPVELVWRMSFTPFSCVRMVSCVQMLSSLQQAGSCLQLNVAVPEHDGSSQADAGAQ